MVVLVGCDGGILSAYCCDEVDDAVVYDVIKSKMSFWLGSVSVTGIWVGKDDGSVIMDVVRCVLCVLWVNEGDMGSYEDMSAGRPWRRLEFHVGFCIRRRGGW